MKLIKKNYKRGIAMVELIFAIVIIGVVLLSAPMLIYQASQSNTVALQQEAIAAVAAHTRILLSKHWDEADANLLGGIAPILKTSFNDINTSPLYFDANTPRKGLHTQSGRLTLYNSNTLSASIIGHDDNDSDDIDDYHNLPDNNISLYANESTDAETGDYVDINLSISTNVTYSDDRPTIFDVNTTANMVNATAIVGTSNIKFVHVTLTTNSTLSELNKNIMLDAFSCNIGTVLINGIQKQ